MPKGGAAKPSRRRDDYDTVSEIGTVPGTLDGMRWLWTPAWIARHVAMVVLVVSFLGLGWWQISRATAGNSISWGYAVEWPVFAGFVVYVWWREVRLARRSAEGAAESPADATDPAGSPAEATAAESTPAATTGSRPAVRRPVRVSRVPATAPPAEDADLAAYNDYLSWLNANPGARPGDYPG